MSYSKEELAAYRIDRSKESLTEAKILSKAKHWNTVANRLYYACFYITSAYLMLNNFEASTHNGIKSTFNKTLIKSGKIDRHYGQLYNNLFNIRQEADYRDFKDVQEEKIHPLISKVEKLVDILEQIMLENL